uniref:Uncharacterized protein n=1 Tax=Oncorhynchus tshawytscha TaxID=74940 RepID=A0AAZ3PVK9_ONCTS
MTARSVKGSRLPVEPFYHMPFSANIASYMFFFRTFFPAVIERQADELEGSLLDEVGVEDAHLCGLPGDVVCHRLPEALCTPLRGEERW